MRCLLRKCENEAVLEGLCLDCYRLYRTKAPQPRCPKCGELLCGYLAREKGECYDGCEERQKTKMAYRARHKPGQPKKQDRKKRQPVVEVSEPDAQVHQTTP